MEFNLVLVDCFAGVAQLVERYLAKVVVAGSTPVSRLNSSRKKQSWRKRNEDNGFFVQESANG